MSSSDPKRRSKEYTWAEGKVDRKKPHLELRYGDAKAGYEAWTPVCLVGKPIGLSFPVQWQLDVSDARYEEIVTQARQELDFYFVELNEENPWAYACYHCCTASNMYSSIHWSYFPEGLKGERRASFIVRMDELDKETDTNLKARTKKRK